MSSTYSREEKFQYQYELIEKKIREKNGLAKTKELTALGIDYRRIIAFVEKGWLIRVKNGYFTSKYWDGKEEDLIVQLFPDGILTMESGLYYYGYLKEMPYGWSIAISKNTSKSRFKMDYPIVKPYYSEPQVLELGREKIKIGNQEMGIYSKERIICDCLKYQEKMDREDFKQAAWSYINDPKKDIAALMMYAKERKVLKKVQTMIGVWL